MRGGGLLLEPRRPRRRAAGPGPAPGELVFSGHGLAGSAAATSWSGTASPKAPIVLGHEVAGEVVEIGAGLAGFARGTASSRPTTFPATSAVTAARASTRSATRCRTTRFDPGGFAESCAARGQSRARDVRAPRLTSPSRIASFVEPLATVVRGQRTTGLAPGDSVLVYGAGIAGMLFVKLAKALGAGTVAVVDVDDYRLQAARAAGADLTVRAGADVPGAVRGARRKAGRQGRRLHRRAYAAKAALRSVDAGGTVLFFAVGKPGDAVAVDFNPFWRNSVTLCTSYGAAPLKQPPGARSAQPGHRPGGRLTTHRFALDDIGEAFRSAARPGECLKVLD